jgi:hypothetical protein
VAQAEFAKRHALQTGLIFKDNEGLKPIAFKLYATTELTLHRLTDLFAREPPQRPDVWVKRVGEGDALQRNRRDQNQRQVRGEGEVHVVALQDAFERRTLKPGFHLIGYRLWV